jgi:hypothetical protein
LEAIKILLGVLSNKLARAKLSSKPPKHRFSNFILIAAHELLIANHLQYAVNLINEIYGN